MTPNNLRRLQEIREEFLALLEEARQMLGSTSEEERAKSYWWAHIRCAIDNEHMFLGGSMITMQDTIEALQEEEEEEEEEEDLAR